MTEFFRVLDIIVGVIFLHRPFGIMTQDRGVNWGVVVLRICSVRLRMVDLGQMSSSPEALWLIFLSLNPFFLDTNFRVTKIVARR